MGDHDYNQEKIKQQAISHAYNKANPLRKQTKASCFIYTQRHPRPFVVEGEGDREMDPFSLT